MKDEMKNAGKISNFKKTECEDVNRIEVQDRVQWQSYRHCTELVSSIASRYIS
jgi:hypothetical protein